jgi:hypothetical protein
MEKSFVPLQTWIDERPRTTTTSSEYSVHITNSEPLGGYAHNASVSRRMLTYAPYLLAEPICIYESCSSAGFVFCVPTGRSNQVMSPPRVYIRYCMNECGKCAHDARRPPRMLLPLVRHRIRHQPKHQNTHREDSSTPCSFRNDTPLRCHPTFVGTIVDCI